MGTAKLTSISCSGAEWSNDVVITEDMHCVARVQTVGYRSRARSTSPAVEYRSRRPWNDSEPIGSGSNPARARTKSLDLGFCESTKLIIGPACAAALPALQQQRVRPAGLTPPNWRRAHLPGCHTRLFLLPATAALSVPRSVGLLAAALRLGAMACRNSRTCPRRLAAPTRPSRSDVHARRDRQE